MKLSEILVEHYVNLITPQQRMRVAQYVWELIQKTYQDYAEGTGTQSLEDLVTTPGVWKLAVRQGQVRGGAIYRDSKGRKLRLVFHDGTPEGKAEMKKIMADDIARGRAWGEFSGALEKVMLKLGGIPVPNTQAEKILGKSIDKLDDDGYHYWRNVGGGRIKREIIIGKPTA